MFYTPDAFSIFFKPVNHSYHSHRNAAAVISEDGGQVQHRLLCSMKVCINGLNHSSCLLSKAVFVFISHVDVKTELSLSFRCPPPTHSLLFIITDFNLENSRLGRFVHHLELDSIIYVC